MVLTCEPAADVPLDGCNPDVREKVYEPDACHPLARRFSAASTSPL